ncbi:IucA/IucC family siderophore biosynthesis protein [Halogeometricum sp. S1BR25-6]|uniref:IucA/IucC family siderophore biosynthesis protein n=1 Tax=Halogeometricum salsisoli TaxID=2950536 RepID=A0ABU2GJJ8_9EURY|nr:IucA/IucC family siderophore biosynthesis protein [Halogeometricum sp. S1BR25-6]MDS0300463.1 IucA/IucC family siderophore biosynthesis protein [Halogeometricum sp. S1BR25-6]
MNPNDTIRDDALDADVWETVERRLLAKMLEEFAYEEIVDPERVETGAGSDREAGSASDGGTYRFELGDAAYRFRAEERLMESLSVDGDSVERRATDGTTAGSGGDEGWNDLGDPLTLLRDVGESTELEGLTEGNLVREYKRTLLADAHVEARARRRTDDGGEFDPLDLGYAELEGEMDGHPWLTYNKGRLGWGYDDYREYAPETKNPVTLSWVAISREKATFVSTDELDHDSLVKGELGDRYGTFRERLESEGLDPDDYYFLPVHDWQWEHSVVPLFPDDIARDDIVPLGEGPDEYLPQQSVRTFVNVDSEAKHHVKVPMRILNTLVWRGLPGERTELAPTVTEYVKGIRENDEFLREEGLILPGEVAGLNYDHDDFTDIDGSPYQYHELLGTVWREPIYEFLEDEERAVTLSSLMHVDGEGVPYVSRLIEASGLTADEWLSEFFETVLPPLLHYLYRYGTVFSPHGQNTILVVEDGVPSRLAVKDFVDDVNVSDRPLPELEALPDEVHEVLRKEPPEGLCQFVFSGLFVCVLRYVADVLERHEDYAEERFWTHAREAVLAYQAEFPELEDRFELFDLLRPEFTKLALNRNRIFEYGYDDAPGRPHAAEHGTVRNPLHAVAEDDADDAARPHAADD